MLPMVLNLWRSSSLWDSSSHLCKGTSLLMFHGTSKQCSAPNPSCKEKASWKKLQPISINVTTALSVRELESGMHRKKKNSLPESLQTILMNGLAGNTIFGVQDESEATAWRPTSASLTEVQRRMSPRLRASCEQSKEIKRTYLVVGQPHRRLTNGTPCKCTQTTREFGSGRTEVLQRFRAGAREGDSVLGKRIDA